MTQQRSVHCSLYPDMERLWEMMDIEVDWLILKQGENV